MVLRWDVITIGNLSRNRYWGESDETPRRAPLCTSTVVTVDGLRLIVDPSITDATQMAVELDRRTGLTPSHVDAVFITHDHGDHHAGLAAFASARWLAAAPVADAINASGRYTKRFEPAQGAILPGIEVLATPGHTLGHHSLAFTDAEGRRVVIAGDAVMTRDFWRERKGFFNSADFDMAAATIERLTRAADIIVPGHDNYFLCGRR